MFKTIFKDQPIRFINHAKESSYLPAIQSFAIEDTLCHSVGSECSPTTVRTWVHEDTIVLGIQDTRLPHLEKGIHFLQEQGYDVIVRNSGGLAVVLDVNILNVSIIFKDIGYGIDDGYEIMYHFVKEILSPYTSAIEAKEIVGSYCPGSYDLSIRNLKFSGLSQRRMRNGISVQAYLCVNGNGEKRAEIIRDFYNISKGNSDSKVPTIIPSTMASLSDLVDRVIHVSDISNKIKEVLLHHHVTVSDLNEDEVRIFNQYLQRMEKRNEKIITIL